VGLIRLEVDKLSDEALAKAFLRSLGMAVKEAEAKFAAAVIARPSMKGKEEYFRALAALARMENGSDRSIEYLHQARDASLEAGHSCAPWDLMELSFRFQRLDATEAGALLQHIQERHLREPGIRQAVQRLLMDYGLMRADGMPVGPRPKAEPEIVVPGDQAGQPGELWTPEGAQPEGQKSKLWVPGMD
jgi:hypothetical protein